MNTVSLHHFEQLKQNVVLTAGIKNMSSSECKNLSDSIFKKTYKRISETTLKRVFGFALTRFNPSTFTVDVMSQYCGYVNWGDFCEKQEHNAQNTESAKDINWDVLKKNAQKVTHFTLQSLKNRSGIPYNQTIKRTFINDHFQFFFQGYYTGTIFTAPSGYGKTIALCHWIDERLELNVSKNRNEIILFFSSNALINNFLSGKSLNEWLLSLLGLHPNDNIETLLSDNVTTNNNFFLIIDGFDSHLFKSTQYESLFNEIIDIVALYKNVPWFKVILTMRTATYINNKHLIFNSNRSTWFPGFSIDDDLFTNVPLLNVEEIRRLCYKINPHKNHIITIDIAENFNNPLFFQFYYQNNLNNFSLNDVDQVTIYELIAIFVCNKVYQGTHSEDKVLLINGLVSTIDFKNQVFMINKLKVHELLKTYRHAYRQLLSMGYLRELNTSNELDFRVSIQFGANNFLAYSVAEYLLNNSTQSFDGNVVSFINTSFANNEYKLPTIKWCIINSLKNEQYNFFELLTDIKLPVSKKAELMLFIANVFDKKQSSMFKIDQLKNYWTKADHNSLFNYFFGLEFINSDFEKPLLALLKFNISGSRKIMVYTALAAIAITKLDLNKFESYLSELRSFANKDFNDLLINPLSCLETIYYYLKYGIVKHEAFAELTRFYFNIPQNANTTGLGDGSLDILYLLGIYTLSICQNARKTIRFINAVNKVHPNSGNYPPGYELLLKSARVDALFSLNNPGEAMQLFKELTADYTSQIPAYTPFIKLTFHLLTVRTMLHDAEQPEIINEVKTLIHLSEEMNYTLIKVHALVLMLINRYRMKSNPEYYRQLHYDFTKVVLESGFRSESFIPQESAD